MVKFIVLVSAFVVALVSAAPPTNNPVESPDPFPPGSTVCNGYNDGVYLRNPANCTQYYHCPFLRPCPAGLVFNQELRVCTWDAPGVCSMPLPPPPGPAPPTGPIGPPSLDNPVITIPNPLPPQPNQCTGYPTGTYLRDLTDCTRYFHCPYHRPCPAGLVFHQGLRVCTWDAPGVCNLPLP